VDIRTAQKKKSAPDKKPPAGPAKKAAPDAKPPPGWQKKIARGEVLPQEVYAQAQALPEVVIRKLPPPPAGTILVTLDGKLVRLLEATRIIVDVFELK
jgi:Ni/Co efflux regulator RcnB